jgi:hypothetical protein
MTLRSLPAAGLRFHARLVRALPSARAPVAAVVPESTGLNVATVSHLAAVSALFMRVPPPTTLVYPFPALPLHTHPLSLLSRFPPTRRTHHQHPPRP